MDMNERSSMDDGREAELLGSDGNEGQLRFDPSEYIDEQYALRDEPLLLDHQDDQRGETALEAENEPLYQQQGDLGGDLGGVVESAGIAAGNQAARPPRQPHHKRPKPVRKLKPPVLRSWLKVTGTGETQIIQAERNKLISKLGIQTRDLRIMDPRAATTYPSCILSRENALVVNLEYVKVIIATDYVLVTNPDDEHVVPFVAELRHKLAQPVLPVSKSFPVLSELASNYKVSGKGALGGALGSKGSLLQAVVTGGAAAAGSTPGGDASGTTGPAGGGGGGGGDTAVEAFQFPFELKALEVCLDTITTYLEGLTSELEATAYPSLDDLTRRVSSPNLERVRRIKNRLVRLHTRVETLHEVLEKLLNDDEDMRDLNLTAALLERQERAEREATRALLDQQAAAAAAAAFGSSPGGMTADYDGRSDRSSSSASSNSTSSSDAEAEVAEVEMLLEAYFMHIDNTYNRLQTLDEYIKDTEDFVQLELSQQRNRLITLDLVLTAWSTALAMPTMVGGIFGMNLTSQLEDEPSVFYQVAIASSVLCVVAFAAFVTFCWYKKLLVY